MNLINFLKQLLYKLRKEKKDNDLLNFETLIPTLKREDFLDTIKIDKYKSEYLNTLNQNRTLTLNDLNSDSLKKQIGMYIDLFILNCPDEVNITHKNVFEEEAKRRITSLKLKTYLQEVEDLILEIKYRLVALEEILNDLIPEYKKISILSSRKKYLLRNKIDCLESLINLLEGNLICSENQAKALLLSLNTYEQKYEFNYSLIDKDEFKNPEKIIDGHLNFRWESVSKDLRVVTGLNDTITNSNCSLLSKIVSSEIFLEKFVYQNKSLIENSREEIEALEQKLNKIMKDAYKEDLNRDERRKVLDVHFGNTYFSKIRKIEKIYLLFQKYSRNIVGHSDLKKLYKVNFWLMFYDVEHWDYIFVLRDEHPLECSVYENIVLDIINTVMTDKNGFILHEFSMYTVDAIKWIDRYLKDGEKSYSVYDDILLDHEKMRFLLYIYFGLGVRQFLENEEYANNLELGLLGNSLFSPENFIHAINLISYFKALHWLQLINKETDCYKNLIYFRKMFNLLEQIESDSGIYSLPDCITTIKYNYAHKKESELVIDDINSHAINKKVIFPPSLKRIDVNPGLLKNIPIAGIYLNDGLEEILDGSFTSVSIEYLSIPASLRNLSSKAFDYKSVKVLEFRDYTASALKESYKTLVKILESLLLNEIGFLTGVEEVIEDRNYNKQNVSIEMSEEDYFLYDNQNYRYIRSLVNSTNLETLVFTDEELDEPIIIELNELESIKIPYDMTFNQSNEMEYYPLVNSEKAISIIKSIKEKVETKRKRMLGRSLRK